MNIRAALFDLDGTLVDSLADLTDAVNHIREVFSRPPLTADSVRTKVGKGARNLVQQALPDVAESDVDRALSMFIEYNRLHVADKSRLYAGIQQVLNELAAQGIRMAVISNKNEDLSILILRLLGIHELFEHICGGDTCEENKPSPLPLQMVMNKMGVARHECVMIGDSINDIEAGKRAGVLTIACTWGYGDAGELAGADFFAQTPGDLHAAIISDCRKEI